MSGLLEHVRVLDFGIWRPVSYATQLLAELGADVIKVEPPGGDPMRIFPELFAMLNANKRSMVLDLKNPNEQARARDLARDADVVIEGFRPGVAARLGIGPGELRGEHPPLVYCSISGYGQNGPEAHTPGHDLNYQARSAALAPDGREPHPPAVPIADIAAGMTAAMSILAAYVHWLHTGEGEYIDVSMTDVLATWVTPFGEVATSDGGSLGSLATYGIFRCRDGWVTLGIMNEDHFWDATCEVLGLASLAGLPFSERLARSSEIKSALESAFAASDADDVCERLSRAGAPAAPVHSREQMLHDEHLVARGLVTANPWQPVALGYPAVFAERSAAWTNPPPALNEHADAAWLAR